MKSSADGSLVGRAAELDLATEALRRAGAGEGGALLIDGEPGIGKTAFAWAVQLVAERRGFRVLECAGVRNAEAAGFAGLHQLLQPLLTGLDALPLRQASALKVAFGMSDEGEADRLLLGLAALGLVEEAAEASPILMIAEDLHWVDASTHEVIAFLAKRLRGTRAFLLATTRSVRNLDELASQFPDHVHLESLDRAGAAELILRRAPALPDRALELVLDSSLGNPLALTEFASTARSEGNVRRGRDDRLPITDRLERTFLSEMDRLPDSARRAMLVAAAGQGADLEEVVAALGDLGLSERDFIPAERLDFLRLRGGTYEFKHPLVSSALYDAADSGIRADTHRALADVISDPGRSAWHRAAATSGWDEAIAAELEKAARVAEGRGARTEASAAWRRAADLTPGFSDRARRLVAAAEAARQAGRPALAAELVDQAGPVVASEADVLQLARTEWMLSQTTGFQGRSARDLAELATGFTHDDDKIEVLVFAAVRAYILGEPSDVKTFIADGLRAVPTGGDDVFQGIGLTLMEPGTGANDVEASLRAFDRRLRPTDAVLLNCLAFSAEEINDLDAAETVWDAATRAFHSASRTSDEATGLCGRGGLRITAGHITDGLADVEQALHLSRDLDLGVVGGMAAAQIAHARALRGERGLALDALKVVTDLSGPQPFARIAATAEWAAAQLALNEGQYGETISHLDRTAVNAPVALWAGGDYAEAAARSGERREAEAWLARATRIAEETRSSHLRVIVERSRGLLSDGPEARSHFEAAIEAGENAKASVDLAKARLFFGEWLRRERRIVEARSQLWEAVRLFEAESIRPLAERAAAELRAAGGVDSARSNPVSADIDRLLTGQEIQVVRLAADGLTNKEIADQIYLSHRTVGAHLHRAFGKLGISRRSQLSGLLRETSESG
ncbi:AAA family ATPase [Herbiconiux sp. CPCC 205716]|uniref:AAA family ATPase n=1 Tax=Herbiconiux gentiana TaxID=2970912 RepID=A0ABT2GFW6_9MICO|nr:LuxR family transcriptional regulator [Herbiconiux gentiana]MCS5714180.1 AAA family ATPase [Herbiconiux gentiana]